MVSRYRRSSSPVDNMNALSDSTNRAHQRLIDAVPQEALDRGAWKHEVFRELGAANIMNSDALKACFDHLEDLSKTRNKRIYIGPGRDGSSEDKISIDCKFYPQNTKVTYPHKWLHGGIKKTTSGSQRTRLG